MSRIVRRLTLVLIPLIACGGVFFRYSRGSRLRLSDFTSFLSDGRPVGLMPEDSLERLGVKPADLRGESTGDVRFLGMSKYLNHARAVVTHTIDDSTRYVPRCLDAIDK